MKLNALTAVVGQGVVFVPYRREHVERYHAWLSTFKTRPLDIDKEYLARDMWEEDENTLVFVVLARPRNKRDGDISDDEVKRLPSIGVVHLFLRPGDRGKMAEVMIFIGEPEYQNDGYDSAALQLLLSYATSSESGLRLAPYNFFVHVPVDNEPFKALFRKFGFDRQRPVPEHPDFIKLSAGGVSWDADFDLRDWPED